MSRTERVVPAGVMGPMRQMGLTRLHQKLWCALFLILLPLASSAQTTAAPTESASPKERLAIAIDYFQGGKYHEAKMLLQPLDKQYRLNPRFRAYLGLCHYYDWEYAEAVAILDSVIPKLKAFAPQERSVYCFAAAESHFNLQQYSQALPFYEQMATLCKDTEKPDAYYKMGFIHVYEQQWLDALDDLQSALVYYQQHRPGESARIAQIRNMIRGCCEKIEKERYTDGNTPPHG